MAANGVSHQVVEDDLEGVRAVLTWLAFTPVRLGGPPPHLPSADPADRAVAVAPAEGERASRPGPTAPGPCHSGISSTTLCLFQAWLPACLPTTSMGRAREVVSLETILGPPGPGAGRIVQSLSELSRGETTSHPEARWLTLTALVLYQRALHTGWISVSDQWFQNAEMPPEVLWRLGSTNLQHPNVIRVWISFCK